MKKVVALMLALAVLLSLSGCFGESERLVVRCEIPRIFSEGNPYAYYYDAYRSYILPDSCTAYLCWADVSHLSSEELYLARQEIYAQYGQQFDDLYLTEYFSAYDWYTPGSTDVSEQLSQQANMNLFLLEVYEATQDNSVYNWGNPYLALCSADYMVEDSSRRSLTANDLQHLTSKELVIARNEIFARHGYIFSDQDLRTYFYTKPWYRPTTPADEFDFSSLSALEVANVELIQQYEENAPSTNTGSNTGNGGNNNETTGGVPSQITVVDKYTYLLNKNCYHIPYVDLPTAAAINKEMYEDCYGILERHVFAEPSQPMIYRMLYSVGRQGDVVSVMVYAYQDWDCDMILVYNFSASTGRKLSDSQVYEAYGLSAADGKEMLRKAIALYWEAYINRVPAEHWGALEACRDKTLADGNVADWKPYINANGALCFTGSIYSIAGAESYEHNLDQQGNDISGLNCAVH